MPDKCICLEATFRASASEETIHVEHIELCEWSPLATLYLSICKLKKNEIPGTPYFLSNLTNDHKREYYAYECRLFHSHLPRLFVF